MATKATIAITMGVHIPATTAAATQNAAEVRHVKAETYRYTGSTVGAESLTVTNVTVRPAFVPKTAIAKKLYAIRQREIAAGRLVLRDSQDILDEIAASRM